MYGAAGRVAALHRGESDVMSPAVRDSVVRTEGLVAVITPDIDCCWYHSRDRGLCFA